MIYSNKSFKRETTRPIRTIDRTSSFSNSENPFSSLCLYSVLSVQICLKDAHVNILVIQVNYFLTSDIENFAVVSLATTNNNDIKDMLLNISSYIRLTALSKMNCGKSCDIIVCSTQCFL